MPIAFGKKLTASSVHLVWAMPADFEMHRPHPFTAPSLGDAVELTEDLHGVHLH
jgi:hypothetical protein